MINGKIKKGDIIYRLDHGDVKSYTYVGLYPHTTDKVIVADLDASKRDTLAVTTTELNIAFFDEKQEVYRHAIRQLQEKVFQYQQLLEDMDEDE